MIGAQLKIRGVQLLLCYALVMLCSVLLCCAMLCYAMLCYVDLVLRFSFSDRHTVSSMHVHSAVESKHPIISTSDPLALVCMPYMSYAIYVICHTVKYRMSYSLCVTEYGVLSVDVYD
jgi:hypothetical protein